VIKVTIAGLAVPEDLDRFVHRDTRARFIAYVLKGAKGEALVKSGGKGATIQCAICHGPDLKGLGGLPGIAGRSASHIVRQLYDIKSGGGGCQQRADERGRRQTGR